MIFVCGACHKSGRYDDGYVTQVRAKSLGGGGAIYHRTCAIVCDAMENPETGLHDEWVLLGESGAGRKVVRT